MAASSVRLQGAWQLAGGHGREVFTGLDDKLAAHAAAGLTTLDTAGLAPPFFLFALPIKSITACITPACMYHCMYHCRVSPRLPGIRAATRPPKTQKQAESVRPMVAGDRQGLPR
jgi:hypothetical protein